MRYRFSMRVCALILLLALLVPPTAQALTVPEARTLLSVYYIDDIPPEVLEKETIPDMLEALGDPYTSYFTAEEYGQFISSMRDQDIVGVGISARACDEGLLLQRVYEDTPAARGGLQAGDIIVSVDGRAAAGESLETLTGWIQGAAGTRVRLDCRRGETLYTAVLTRGTVVIPATVSELWEGHIGYIDCDTFGGETLAHFVQAAERYGAQADRWIVDLRGNSGGEVAAAIEAAGVFTGPGTLAFLRNGAGRIRSCTSSQEALLQSPVLVLTDQDTASAAELFAAAIRDTGRGLIVGSRTFGKGVAQNVLDQNVFPQLFPDGDALKITTSRFYSAAGSTDDTIGVLPHLTAAPELAADIAKLLCAPPPEEEETLRLDWYGTWYVNLEQALSADCRTAFTALLEALPAGAELYTGSGGSWREAGAEALAEQYGLDGYQYRGFSDTGGAPLGGAADALAFSGLLQGNGSGAYRPDAPLTRAELCVLLAQVLNCYYPAGESRFSDVSMDTWYGPAVYALTDLGLVSGVGGDRFCPGDPVSREQLIAVMGRLARRLNLFLDMEEMPKETGGSEALSGWPEWAKPQVWLLALSQTTLQGETLSLLWAPLEEIVPTEPATRGETAALVFSLLAYIGILPV